MDSGASASNYVKQNGLLEITLIDNPIIDVSNDSAFWKSISW